MRRCEDEKVWEKMWRWEGVREDVKMRRCEDEKVWEKMWRWEGVREDVKMRRCERRWEGVREDVKMRRWERRCEDEKVGEKMWRWEGVREDVKMRRCERRCEDEKVGEKMWRWGVREDVKMRRCERRCEDEKVWEKMWRWEGVKMRRWDTDPHYWKNPAPRRSREKLNVHSGYEENLLTIWCIYIYISIYIYHWYIHWCVYGWITTHIHWPQERSKRTRSNPIMLISKLNDLDVYRLRATIRLCYVIILKSCDTRWWWYKIPSFIILIIKISVIDTIFSLSYTI